MVVNVQVRYERPQIAFIVLFAVGASIGPFVNSLLIGSGTFLAMLVVGSICVVAASSVWQMATRPLEDVGPGIMGSEEWAYSGIVGCLFLIGTNLMYFFDPYVELTTFPSLVFDVITVSFYGGITAILVFGASLIRRGINGLRGRSDM